MTTPFALLRAEQSRQLAALNASFSSVVERAVAADPTADFTDAARDYLAYASRVKRTLGDALAGDALAGDALAGDAPAGDARAKHARMGTATALLTWGSGDCGQLGRAFEPSLLVPREARAPCAASVAGGALVPHLQRAEAHFIHTH